MIASDKESSATNRDETAAIETDGLTKRYGSVTAVDSLDLSIPAGEVYGFLGPNGSGKSTTMKMLATLVRPTAGTARILGIDIANRDEIIQHIGYLPEQLPLFDELTAREQLRYIGALNDIPHDVVAERAATYFDLFELTGAADRRIGEYSKGMKQKLGIVQAVLNEPPVLLLDEPTSGLDPRAARTVKDLIAELADGNTTIFLSTHILPVVDELADTVGVIHEGRLVTEGSPTRLKRRAETGDEQTLEEAFLAVTADHADDSDDEQSARYAAETDAGER